MKPTLKIDEFPTESVKSGSTPPGGPSPRPLSFWRDLLKKTGGVVPGPEGGSFPVSLAKYEGADDNIMLAIYVEWIDPKLVGTTDPLGKP